MMDKMIKQILLEKLSMGVMVIDKNLNIRYFNKWLQKHSGINENKVLGQQLFQNQLI